MSSNKILNMEEKIKIFVDCHIFDKNFEGTRTYITGLYQELIKDNSKTFYFAAKNTAILEEVFGTAENVKYLELAHKNKFYRLLVDIPKLIKANNIQYAHFQYIVPPIKYCKYINTIHDLLFLEYPQYFPWMYRVKNKFLFKWSVKHSDIIFTVSEYSKQQIQRLFNIDNVVITPNAVNDVFFAEYNKETIKLSVAKKYKIEDYFIYISRWEPRKNHNFLLEVFVENNYYRDFFLVLVGKRDLINKKFNNLYNSLPESIKNKIIILENLSFDDLQLLVKGAEVSIYPSIAEGFGIPILEAAAAGIPSLYSNRTAMKDFSFLHDNGFDPFDKNDLNEKIKINLNKGKKMNNVEIIKEKYNWKYSALLFLEELNNNSSKTK
ncbi:group 1 glycosyl transferase [Flavobacterium sp. F52]|nr:group 1 glycosyl transferase [Flavobacterium sp. F52]